MRTASPTVLCERMLRTACAGCAVALSLAGPSMPQTAPAAHRAATKSTATGELRTRDSAPDVLDPKAAAQDDHTYLSDRP